jgi:hypothetical protein
MLLVMMPNLLSSNEPANEASRCQFSTLHSLTLSLDSNRDTMY